MYAYYEVNNKLYVEPHKLFSLENIYKNQSKYTVFYEENWQHCKIDFLSEKICYVL